MRMYLFADKTDKVKDIGGFYTILARMKAKLQRLSDSTHIVLLNGTLTDSSNAEGPLWMSFSFTYRVSVRAIRENKKSLDQSKCSLDQSNTTVFFIHYRCTYLTSLEVYSVMLIHIWTFFIHLRKRLSAEKVLVNIMYTTDLGAIRSKSSKLSNSKAGRLSSFTITMLTSSITLWCASMLTMDLVLTFKLSWKGQCQGVFF